MSKTLRKRKIAKAYGLKYVVKNIKGTKTKSHVVKRYVGEWLVDARFFRSQVSTPSYKVELAFYNYIDQLRPKTFKSRIGGNY